MSLVLVAALAPMPALADRIEVLGPSSTVSPDGFEIAVGVWNAAGNLIDSADVAIEASGGQVFALPLEGALHVYKVKPSDSKVTVRASSKAGALSRSWSVGPPVSHVSLTLVPAAPVKGKDTSATLSIELKDGLGNADDESAPPVLRANVGSIDRVEKAGPGKFQARYVLPPTRFPEVAVVVAFSAWPHPQSIHGAFGVLRVPLAANVELPGKSEANADLTLYIADKPFGPVRTAADGRFKVPIVVPPGYGKARGTAIDRLGNKRSNSIDLALPPTDQLACVVSPTQLPADGVSRARVLCATSDAYGNIATGAKVSLKVARGKLFPPKPLDRGVTEWIWVAPTSLGSGTERFEASWKEGGSAAHEEWTVQLVQGPAASATAVMQEPLVHLGGSTPVTIDVKDALGRPRSGAHVSVLNSIGKVEAATAKPEGPTVLRWRAPSDARLGKTEVVLRASGPMGTEPSRINVWTEDRKLWAAVTDLAGLPVADQPLVLNERSEVRTDSEGVFQVGALEEGDVSVRHGDWRGLTADVHVRRGVVFPKIERPATAKVSLNVRLAPAVPVVVRVVVQGRHVSYWAETIDGEILPGRNLKVELSGGARRSERVENNRNHFDVADLSAPSTVAVRDVETGIFALSEVAP